MVLSQPAGCCCSHCICWKRKEPGGSRTRFGQISEKTGYFPVFPKMMEMAASVEVFILFFQVESMFITFPRILEFSSRRVGIQA